MKHDFFDTGQRNMEEIASDLVWWLDIEYGQHQDVQALVADYEKYVEQDEDERDPEAITWFQDDAIKLFNKYNKDRECVLAFDGEAGIVGWLPVNDWRYP